MEVFNLNIIPGAVAPVIHASQYDEEREFRANLFEGDQVFKLTGAETISVNVRKPDGNVVTAAVENTGAAYVEFSTTLQMTACAGANLCKLKIENSPRKIGTLNFILAVERDPLEGGIQSESAIHDLQAQIAEAVADQYDADAVIFDTEPTADHGIGYAVTSEGLKNYIPKNVGDLDDVTITEPAQGEALVFDENGNLVNGNVSTVGNLDDLSDVDTTGKASGDSLRYDGNEWIAKPTTIALTQAEYDALQTKEPNTHYVITDAPNLNATASDIEYSSGVTVKQAIDSKQDAFTSGSLTSGTNVTILNGFYNKTGNMVFWSCCFSVSGNINTGAVIFSGLPHGNEQDNLPCFLREIAASDTSLSCRIYRGGVYPNTQLTSGKTYHAFGIYTIE